MTHRKRRAIVVGFDYHGRYLTDLVNRHCPGWSLGYYSASYFDKFRTLLDVRNADALICFGGPAPDAALAEEARRHGVPIVVIWAGTDVIVAPQDPGALEVV